MLLASFPQYIVVPVLSLEKSAFNFKKVLAFVVVRW